MVSLVKIMTLNCNYIHLQPRLLSYQKVTDTIKLTPCDTGENEKHRKREKKSRGQINCLIFRPSNLWLIWDYTLCLCLWPSDLQYREAWSRAKTNWHTCTRTHTMLALNPRWCKLHEAWGWERFNWFVIWPVTWMLFHRVSLFIALNQKNCTAWQFKTT